MRATETKTLSGADPSAAVPLFVAGEAQAEDRAAALEGVEHWLYLIDNAMNADTVGQIAASDHDMVVMDFITSEVDRENYPLADTIDAMKADDPDRLVIAYINVGEAEDYRTYWEDGWGVGNPDWITALDPEGWEGNYPVVYWAEAFQDIWLEEGGYLDQIVEAGFDGVYLDWIEAYEDENVLAAAEDDGLDPEQAMIDWVGAVADHGRSLDPNFIVIAQNAAPLLTDADYRDAIDAIAQEQIWFDGAADNDPAGDCPLPATEDDVDTVAYYNSLPPDCQEQFLADPDCTLHTSSEYYLTNLAVADQYGIPVFTVDYALEQDNIDDVYESSLGLGYTPFTSSRGLDTYVAPYTPASVDGDETDGTDSGDDPGEDSGDGGTDQTDDPPDDAGDDSSDGGTASDPDAETVNVQRGLVGAGAGDDTYVLTSTLIDAGGEIAISDSQGSNEVQCIAGLEITEARVASNTLQMVLGNGAEVTILDAAGFTYFLGGNPLAGEAGTDQGYETFVTDTLGFAALPEADVLTGTVDITIA